MGEWLGQIWIKRGVSPSLWMVVVCIIENLHIQKNHRRDPADKGEKRLTPAIFHPQKVIAKIPGMKEINKPKELPRRSNNVCYKNKQEGDLSGTDPRGFSSCDRLCSDARVI